MRYSHSKRGGIVYIECESGACKSVYALTERELRDLGPWRIRILRSIYRRLRLTVAMLRQGVRR